LGAVPAAMKISSSKFREVFMSFPFDRRQFLRGSVALGGTLLVGGAPLHCGAEAAPARIDAPVVDRVVVQEVTDGAHDIFLRGAELPGLSVQRVGPAAFAGQGRTLSSEWGLALHIESHKGNEARRYLLDFGFTPNVYLNNLDLLKIDAAAVDALILSHGHFDHLGGLIGFLEAQRPRMRKDLRLYTGGEDNFCHRLNRNADGSFTDFGILDRSRLKTLDVQPVLSEVPVVIEGHAFTTGAVPRISIEHVLPNTWVEVDMKDGLGCDAHAYMNHHFTEDELVGKPQPDQHWHEHATCFRLGDRGLVVISSCGHAGIINTLRRAQEVSGVEKIYALVGGFHLAPAPEDYLRQVMAELKKFDLDHVLPMHCSGQNFIDLAKQEMLEKLVLCTTGSRFTFTT
jgi:7,8-dihydropterin-6-yl-methyl-4-(beta-D-ribofuranosyl)aminobenzene 5'-phosphate synthase